MATAPTPGVGRRITEAADVRQALDRVVTITRGDQALSFSLADLGPRDDFACRKATGFNVTTLISSEEIGAGEVLALWWLARRHNGEPDLTFTTVLDEFPTNADVIEAGFGCDVADEPDGGDSPEA